MTVSLTDDELQDGPELLSNPVLDELYSIRRILVSMYRAHARLTNLDPWKLTYYALKVRALDRAIGAYIAQEQVPEDHQEMQLPLSLDSLRTALDAARPAVRIPGEASQS